MTKRQRAQVVELLRCAADQRPDGIGMNGMFNACDELELSSELDLTAWNAALSVRVPDVITYRSGDGAVIDERYRHRLLEAAARVEEGTWP